MPNSLFVSYVPFCICDLDGKGIRQTSYGLFLRQFSDVMEYSGGVYLPLQLHSGQSEHGRPRYIMEVSQESMNIKHPFTIQRSDLSE